MKKRIITTVILITTLIFCFSTTALAKEQERGLPAERTDAVETAAGADVVRNTTFTSLKTMGQLMNSTDPADWSMLYLPEVEQYYWNFSAIGKQDDIHLNINLISNSYLNLEMFLDNGYLFDYKELKAYADDYLRRKGFPDTYYLVLTSCLSNPYILNRPAAVVTDYTYNGRDYSAVFDPDYYYDNNPDLQTSIGFNPPELLRQFVEKGIMEGREGKAGVNMDAYIAKTDAQIAAERAGLKAPGTAPMVNKYSYSRANYYGKLLGHYDYSSFFEEEGTAEQDIAAKARVADGLDQAAASKENGVEW